MQTLEIEWQHLDKAGNTCIRCNDTGEALETVVEKLKQECQNCGWDIVFKETKLSEQDIAVSNRILFNQQAIETILPNAHAAESHCQSCCEFTQNPATQCRTIEFNNHSYESIPASLIRQAACEMTQCC